MAKARRLRRPVAEVPTIWLDRTLGVSHFKLVKWVPGLPALVPASPSAPASMWRRCTNC